MLEDCSLGSLKILTNPKDPPPSETGKKNLRGELSGTVGVGDSLLIRASIF
jgi:hypothetical protein